MRLRDVVSKRELEDLNEKDDACLLCMTHELLHTRLVDNPLCPHCGGKISNESIQGREVPISEVNSVKPTWQQVYKAQVNQCGHCSKYFAFLPEKILWNANHDIYYTGGRSYIIDETNFRQKIVQFNEKHLLKLIQNFTQRVKAGENILEAEHLLSWIADDVEHFIANELYERGLKK